MKNLFQNRKPGFWLTVAAACLALIGAIAYLIAYAAIVDTATGTWDRVFRWAVLALLLGGALVSLFGELFRLHAAPIAAAVLYGIGLALHLVEAVFPLADLLTGVRFYGGNVTLAITFSVTFLLAVLLHIVGSFTAHDAKR